MSKCFACHARDGSGNGTIGRSLGLGDIRPAIKTLTDEQISQLVREGRGKMPANKKFDDEQLAGLTLFLRDLAAGNPDAGRAVAQTQAQPLADVATVYQAKCSACHAHDGSGRTTIGKSLKIPDLTSAPVQGRSAAELADIVAKGQGKMPAYSKTFNPVQIGQLVSYVRSFAQSVGASTTTASTPPASPAPPASAPHPSPQVSGRVTPQLKPAAPAPNPAAGTLPIDSPSRLVSEPAGSAPVVGAPVGNALAAASEIYRAKCSTCHSKDGSSSGTVGRSLHIPSLVSPDVQAQSDEHLASVIANGAGRMPAYKKKCSPGEIRLLVTYIRELGKKH